MFCLLLMNFQCNEDDNEPTLLCDEFVVVDNSTYQAITSDFYDISAIEVDTDCLRVHISASGCDSNSWVLTLVDSEDIIETLPPQRLLKLALENNEVCLAVFTKAQSFNLTQLRIDGVNEIVINIEGYDEPLTYAY